MINSNERLFSCKIEELAPVARFILYNLQRDLDKFSAFSSKFNEDYVAETETKIQTVENLVDPKTETLAKKIISDRITGLLIEISELTNNVEGYLKLAKPKLKISSNDFGLSTLRKAVNKKDVEDVLKSVALVTANILHYKQELVAAGMNDTLIDDFNNVSTSIKTNHQESYETVTKRRLIVQSNLSVLNDLYARLVEITAIGKILFKKDPVKLSGYNFSALLKRVHQAEKQTPANNETNTVVN